jgi:hypothetical protein
MRSRPKDLRGHSWILAGENKNHRVAPKSEIDEDGPKNSTCTRFLPKQTERSKMKTSQQRTKIAKEGEIFSGLDWHQALEREGKLFHSKTKESSGKQNPGTRNTAGDRI